MNKQIFIFQPQRSKLNLTWDHSETFHNRTSSTFQSCLLSLIYIYHICPHEFLHCILYFTATPLHFNITYYISLLLFFNSLLITCPSLLFLCISPLHICISLAHPAFYSCNAAHLYFISSLLYLITEPLFFIPSFMGRLHLISESSNGRSSGRNFEKLIIRR